MRGCMEWSGGSCLNAMREEQTHPTLLAFGWAAVGAGMQFAEGLWFPEVQQLVARCNLFG